jgi:5-carboxymethyl-2-hydroxymuconate isomerase
MPHLIIDHSANVAAVTDMGLLVEALHVAALDTGIAPLDALRTRAIVSEHYSIADRHADNMYIAVTARLGAGRSDEQKRTLIEALMTALDQHLGEAQRSIMLSVEYREIDPDFRINKNNLRPIIAERTNLIWCQAPDENRAEHRRGDTDDSIEEDL